MNTIFTILVVLIISLMDSSSPFDLSSIKTVAGKGRIQDVEYNPNLPVIQQIIKEGKKSIPRLIDMLEDETILPNCLVPYWSEVRVGDLAFIILIDFFTDSTWQRSTIPNMLWKEFLEAPENSKLTAEQHLRDFIKKNGRKTIKRKWQDVWRKYHEQVFWDDKERCFNLRTNN